MLLNPESKVDVDRQKHFLTKKLADQKRDVTWCLVMMEETISLIFVILLTLESIYKLKKKNDGKLIQYQLNHVERKVPKYKNHKLRERKVKTLTRN